jgi:hypothetical protein
MATAIHFSPHRLAWLGSEKPAGKRQPLPGPADYAEILEKHEERLIRDIGLTRDGILGPQGSFWREWDKRQSLWQL